jgi:Intra-flagellar transport protein 57
MDPVLIMDDIIEKLHLLDYQTKFCRVRGIRPLSRTFFAFRDETMNREFQLRYFFDLSYWLMSLADE